MKSPAIQSLLYRASTGMLINIALAPHRKRDSYEFWQGYAKALNDLSNGVGEALAEKDARLNGYLPPSVLRAAASVLGVHIYSESRLHVEQRLAQAGIKVPFDSLPDVDIAATQVVENRAVSTVDLHYEHSVAGVDAGNGSGFHNALPYTGAILTEGGAA